MSLKKKEKKNFYIYSLYFYSSDPTFYHYIRYWSHRRDRQVEIEGGREDEKKTTEVEGKWGREREGGEQEVSLH